MKIWNTILYNVVQRQQSRIWVKFILLNITLNKFIVFLGVNSYSQIVSAFRAQGDLTEDQLTILPVLQNALGITRERHTAEIKRAIYDEQLSEIASRFIYNKILSFL